MTKEKMIYMRPDGKPTLPPGSSKDIQRGYEDLCIAIIMQAVEDIRDMRAENNIAGCCRLYKWLRSDWTRLLLGDLDPEYIIRRLRDEEKQNNEAEG